MFLFAIPEEYTGSIFIVALSTTVVAPTYTASTSQFNAHYRVQDFRNADLRRLSSLAPFENTGLFYGRWGVGGVQRMSVPVEDSLFLLVPEVAVSTTFLTAGNCLSATRRNIMED